MTDVIAWIDVETTGLIAHEEHLLEIACIMTDGHLNILDETGYQAVIQHSPAMVGTLMLGCSEFVANMHTKTGLWEKLPTGTPLEVVDAELLEYISRFASPREAPVGGNSVRLDLNFIDEHLPRVAGHLDYHMVDVSTVAILASAWYDTPWLEKRNDHTAMTDIRESIRELAYYRKEAFKP